MQQKALSLSEMYLLCLMLLEEDSVAEKNQYLHHDYAESNLKKHKYRMTTVIKSKDFLPQRAAIMMSLCPTKLYGQQVSNTRQRNRSMARRLNCNLCPSTAVQVPCFVSFLPLKSKPVHKACTKLNMMGGLM